MVVPTDKVSCEQVQNGLPRTPTAPTVEVVTSMETRSETLFLSYHLEIVPIALISHAAKMAAAPSEYSENKKFKIL